MDANIPEGFQLDSAPASPPHAGGMPEGFQLDSPAQDVPEGFQLDEQKYGGIGQGIQAGLEGVVHGTVGHTLGNELLGPGHDLPGAPGMKTGFNLSSLAGIKGREEQHPIASTVGEIGGLTAGALTGTGEAALLEDLGKGATKVAGLAEPVSYGARVGSSIVKNAAEMAAFQLDDEVSKAIQDPNYSAQSAIANIGLASALGAGGGAISAGVLSPLWKAVQGAELTDTLSSMVGRLGGKEGAAGKAAELEAQAGVAIPPELKAVIDQEPGAMNMYSTLNQTDHTWGGRNVQNARETLENNLSNNIIGTFGHTPESAATMPEVNPFKAGKDAGDTLVSEIEPVSKEISNRYDKINNKFKTLELTPTDRITIADRIAQKAMEEGWHKSEDEAQQNLTKKILTSLDKQENVGDLKKYLTNLSDAHPYGSPTYRAAKDISRIIKDQQEKIIMSKLGPEELAGYTKLRGDYSKMMNTFDNLNEHLHIGRYDGPQSFVNNLKDMASSNPEGLLNRLSGKNKADVLQQLQMFPETLAKVKQFHIDQLLEKSGMDTAEGARTNIYKLLNNLDKMTPETRNLILSPGQQSVIDGSRQIMAGIKDPTFNYSKTGRTMAKLMNETPSAISFIAALMGHTEAGILSFLGKMGFNEGKDAVKLSLLKMLGSDKPINAAGFKAAVTYFDKAAKGAKILNKAAVNVLKPGAKVLMSSQIPTAAEIAKLDKLVASNDPKEQNSMVTGAVDTPVGHYIPEHASAMNQASFQSLQYLKTLKPQPTQNTPFDKPIAPSAIAEARYNRALEIAQQPAIVLQHIKDGTLQSTDVQDIKTMYPDIYKELSQKLTAGMMGRRHDEEPIPYKTIMNMGIFLGQPLDTTMAANGIRGAQSAFIPKAPPQEQPNKKSKGAPGKLGKDNASYKTTTQAAESDRSKRD